MGGDARGAEDPSDDEYEHVSYLGQGSFGRVALVRRKSDGEPLVVVQRAVLPAHRGAAGGGRAASSSQEKKSDSSEPLPSEPSKESPASELTVPA